MTAAAEHMAQTSASFMFRSTSRMYRLSDRVQDAQNNWSPMSFLRVYNDIPGSGANFFFTLNGLTASSSLASGIHFGTSPSFFVPARSYIDVWYPAVRMAGVLTGATAGAIIVQCAQL